MTRAEHETCWTLIRGAADGNTSDREEFARRYLPTVRTYLESRWRSSSLRHGIDDVVQEVFVACFRDSGALTKADPRHDKGFRAFLYAVTRNVALHVERTEARRANGLPATETGPDETPADEKTLSRCFDEAYARSIIHSARRLMAERAGRTDADAERRVELLRLRFEEGQPIRDIATIWNADAAKLHRDYARARQEYQTALYDTVIATERCTPDRVEVVCAHLLEPLRNR